MITNHATTLNLSRVFVHFGEYLLNFLLSLKWHKCVRNLSMVFLSMSAGSIAVTQSGFNVQLARWCGDPLRSAFISTLIGVTELYCGMLFLIFCRKSSDLTVSTLRENLQRIKAEISSHKMYLTVLIWPGILGVIWLSTAIFLTPVLGFGLYYITVISGQIMSSVLTDHFGLFWSKTRTLSIHNALGVVMAIFGIFLFSIEVVVDDYEAQNRHRLTTIIGCSAVSVLVGCCLTVQSSLNGKLKMLMNGTAYEVTLISFTNSIVVLFVLSIITYCVNGDWFAFDEEALEWYIFNGGFMGPFIVGIYVICPQHIGFSATFIAGILGYLGTSVIFDNFGIFGVERTELTVWKLCGVTSVLIASVLVTVRRKDSTAEELEIQHVAQKHMVRVNSMSSIHSMSSINSMSSITIGPNEEEKVTSASL